MSVCLCAVVGNSCKRSEERAANTTRPNGRSVILITLDTTRADHLGCYGYGKPTSPRIDRFAQGATIFDNAISAAAVTPVSLASIHTGLYPYRHGLRVLHGLTENRLPDQVVTLGEVLQDTGYQTAAFISAFPAGSRFGLHQGFDTFNEDFLRQPMTGIVSTQGTVNTGENQRIAGATTDLALDWLGGIDGPFFLWVHYFDPHDKTMLPPVTFLRDFPTPTGSMRKKLKTIYDIEIQYMDQQIGRIFDALDQAPRGDETIAVIVSDHGEGLGDHNWWTHGILYQEQIRTPLIIRAPGVPGGRRVPHLVRTVDVMPTVLALVGLDAGHESSLDGRSLVAMLEAETPDPGYAAYADSVNMLTYGFAPGITDRKDDMLFSVMDGRWKYIHHVGRKDESELYDLAADPGELNNLYAVRSAEVERLKKDLKRRDFQPHPEQAIGKMSPEDVERLKALGYLE